MLVDFTSSKNKISIIKYQLTTYLVPYLFPGNNEYKKELSN